MEKEVVFLALTIAAELPVAMVVFGKQDWQRLVMMAISVNLITHPIAWHFAAGGTSILLLEVIITTFEALLFATVFPAHRLRAFAAGVTMNVVSALIGILFF